MKFALSLFAALAVVLLPACSTLANRRDLYSPLDKTVVPPPAAPDEAAPADQTAGQPGGATQTPDTSATPASPSASTLPNAAADSGAPTGAAPTIAPPAGGISAPGALPNTAPPATGVVPAPADSNTPLAPGTIPPNNPTPPSVAVPPQ